MKSSNIQITQKFLLTMLFFPSYLCLFGCFVSRCLCCVYVSTTAPNNSGFIHHCLWGIFSVDFGLMICVHRLCFHMETVPLLLLTAAIALVLQPQNIERNNEFIIKKAATRPIRGAMLLSDHWYRMNVWTLLWMYKMDASVRYGLASC